MIKTLIIAGLIGLTTFSAAAQDKTITVTIAAGLEGRGYDKRAHEMKERLLQRGYSDVVVSNNNGSDAITLQACNGKADIWIAQVDAIYARFQEGCALTPVADYGKEYAMLFFPPESEMDNLNDFTESTVVATDGIGSGTELFWNTIVAIENGDNGGQDEWSKAKNVESSVEQLNTMANFGDIQAAILVGSPDSDNVKMLLGQGWTLGYLWDRDIDDQEFNNKSLYESTYSDIVYDGSKTISNYTYEVRSFIGVSKKYANDKTFRTDVAKASQ